MQIHLVVIDPQNDFCDPNGALYVPGAERDVQRLAKLVERLAGRLDDIHITLDSHRKVDVSHPMWWKDAAGRPPAPFTLISSQDVRDGRWTTARPSCLSRSLEYLEELERRNRYTHTVWPYHCLIGDEGHNVHPLLSAAVHDWEDRFAQAEFVTKGSNPWTEHFSAVQAEVPDPEDPSTQVNTAFIETLEEADVILLAGQALSHCVAETVLDIAAQFSDPAYVQKLVLLEDCTSQVPDPPGTTLFSDHVKDFLHKMRGLGMKVQDSASVFA